MSFRVSRSTSRKRSPPSPSRSSASALVAAKHPGYDRDGLVASRITNDALLHASRYSSNPYVRAGVLAVAQHHYATDAIAMHVPPAIPTRAAHRDAFVAVPETAISNVSRSASVAEKREVDQPLRLQTKAHRTTKALSYEVSTVHQTGPREHHPPDHRPANVLITSSTVIEHVSSDLRAVPDSAKDEGPSSSHHHSTVPSPCVIYRGGVEHHKHSHVMDSPTHEEASISSQPSDPLAAAFCTLVAPFIAQFGASAPALSYATQRQRRLVGSQPPRIPQAAATLHPPPSHNPHSPTHPSSATLLQQTFTCRNCYTPKQRGTQCSVCSHQLPPFRRCPDCATLTRGTFCSHCGTPADK